MNSSFVYLLGGCQELLGLLKEEERDCHIKQSCFLRAFSLFAFVSPELLKS